MFDKLCFVCLLLAVAAERMERESAFHKRTVLRNLLQSHFQSSKRQSALHECGSGEFMCVNQRECLPNRYVCDSVNDCGDGSDEPEDCYNRVCNENEIRCASGQCINIEDFCNGNAWCRDESQSRENHPACRDTQSQPVPYTDSSAQYLCVAGIQQVCRTSDAEQPFERLRDPRDAFSKLAQIDIRDICTPIQEWWYDCVLPSFNNTQQCRDADQLVPDLRLKREFVSKALDYVCEENIEVINQEGSCLLKLNEQNQLVIMFKLMTSCAPHIIAFQSSLQRDNYCIPVELQLCVMNAIVEECGDDIAEIANGLADLARDFCKQMQALQSLSSTNPVEQPSFQANIKRHIRDSDKVSKLLKWFF